jgi:FPC/CPF motif-containing protein YcgG
LWTSLDTATPTLAGRLDWAVDAWSDIAARLLDPTADYPCHFGAQGQQQGHNHFTVVDREHAGAYGVPVLARTLRRFHELARSGPKRQSLIALIGPPDPDATLANHHARFWSLLRELHAEDAVPWPTDAPVDPDDPTWQWCFDGEPWFLFVGSPAYRARRSRRLGGCLTVVFQTRRVFDGLGGNTPAGQAAKRRIRARLAVYDDVPAHPYLGDPASSSTHKWRQYALPDDQGTVAARCPYATDR